jgi:hypothetical protein
MTGNGSGENPALPSASEADLQSRSGTQRDQSSSGAETPRAGRRSEPQSLLLDLKILALTLWRVLKAEGVQH